MIWQINYMLQVKLFPLVEKCSLFVGDTFLRYFTYLCHLTLKIILLSLVFMVSL